MAEINSNLPVILQNLRVVQGETANVLSAVLRDASLAVKGHVTTNWPIATGTSLAGWHVVQVDHLEFRLVNEVDYTSFVWIHPNQGGPPPLWEILVTEAIDAINDDIVSFLSARVVALLANP